ncbi:MAG: response regulator [candidate division Zixibacteria bacterium]|jgi:CheY-like chemotaxis protein|nr:response regulator [candidate division Zixibacteria bacterium]NIR64457.1 response regulator [candidate division Zixibacteria bacterium]NIS16453.1 response regulator [candidate division Zixibacteria bacterium]NIS46370.1 response regulator [candidate division Zixibacteria bacterium]NIT52810.1 response regulator [candidate division Zixibacteria bacterium]
MSDGRLILVVDDEEDVVSYLTSLLEDSGYETISALDGAQGFKLAREKKPALITLDITMPEESGVRMFRNLQQTEETSKIPVIIVTGVSSDFKQFIESRRQVHPPEAYFEKPIDKDEFLKKVKELIS